jgi:hypothetical protein
MTDIEGNCLARMFDGDAAAYRDAGVEPPWTRVWSNGVNVTDHPELWTNPERYRRRRR